MIRTIRVIQRTNHAKRDRRERPRPSHGGQSIIVGPDGTLGTATENFLRHDPVLGELRLAWLRRRPRSRSPGGLNGILDRLGFVRAISLPRKLRENMHSVWCSRSAREGLAAANDLIEGFFGERRGIVAAAARAR
ncbi:MAG: hypothetical protein F4213_22165 [Boseongicola sp. SB0677_bin_26]|nr:hypothetical protein [Boseongicola sp. SB0665_bin_10]MYG28686.1 hypothetical protein [Boseongicola sp. SB0677_bin_26]